MSEPRDNQLENLLVSTAAHWDAALVDANAIRLALNQLSAACERNEVTAKARLARVQGTGDGEVRNEAEVLH